MATRITAVREHDVRFPTAAGGDGSDAINRGDYSATYVELVTDRPAARGAGFTFTNGRGNEITRALLMMDANQVWDVDEAIATMALLIEADPYWIEEPTHADDILGHARIQRAVTQLSNGRCRVATGEVAANRVVFKQLLQAEAIGVYVQHLAIFDFLRVGTSLDGRMIEYVDHLHEHFEDPVRTWGGRYLVPEAPGYSSTMKSSSVAEYSFPKGPAWQQATR